MRRLIIKCRAATSNAKYWKSECKSKRGSVPRQPRAVRADKGMARACRSGNKASRSEYCNRKAKSCIKFIKDMDAESKADVLDRVMESLDPETRAALRAKPVVGRERFLAVREAIQDLRDNWWTPANWLELRLKKYLSMRVFTHGHKLFSKKLGADGVWRRATFMKVPGPRHKARKDGIYRDMMVPSPFRGPKAIKGAQDDILKNHHFTVSEVCLCSHFSRFGPPPTHVP